MLSWTQGEHLAKMQLRITPVATAVAKVLAKRASVEVSAGT